MSMAGPQAALRTRGRQRVLVRLVRLISLPGLLGLAISMPATAGAQSREDLERAKESFQAGATAYAAGEYLAAIQALEAAHALTPLPAIVFSLAQAERREYFVGHERGHLDRAIELYRRYIAEVPSGGRRGDAIEALSQLEPLVAQSGGPLGRPPGTAETPRPESARPTRLMITSDAPAARISLDGGPSAPAPLIREVEPGKHRASITAEGFFSEQRDVVAVKGELVPTTVPLRERPSRFEISSPRDAELYLDGQFVGHGGDRVSLELPSGTRRLSVVQKGHRLYSRAVELERGKSQTLHVELQPTLQRKAAHGLFATAGVALGTSVVLGMLALRAEDQAEDFLDRSARGNVSRADLDHYQNALDGRNGYRIATITSLGVTTAVGLAGIFLYNLDKPGVEELYRMPSTPVEDNTGKTTAQQLRVTPVLLPSLTGVQLHARF